MCRVAALLARWCGVLCRVLAVGPSFCGFSLSLLASVPSAPPSVLSVLCLSFFLPCLRLLLFSSASSRLALSWFRAGLGRSQPCPPASRVTLCLLLRQPLASRRCCLVLPSHLDRLPDLLGRWRCSHASTPWALRVAWWGSAARQVHQRVEWALLAPPAPPPQQRPGTHLPRYLPSLFLG